MTDVQHAALLKQWQRDHDERVAALARNPEGGCYYLPHPVQVHSGLFWRCAHGHNAFWARFCARCMLRHPVLAWRWHFGKTK